jgi:hypothetical protein
MIVAITVAAVPTTVITSVAITQTIRMPAFTRTVEQANVLLPSARRALLDGLARDADLSQVLSGLAGAAAIRDSRDLEAGGRRSPATNAASNVRRPPEKGYDTIRNRRSAVATITMPPYRRIGAYGL